MNIENCINKKKNDLRLYGREVKTLINEDIEAHTYFYLLE